MLFAVDEVLRVTAGKLWLGDPGASFNGVIIDSREAKKGELFFPLQGEKENGHSFVFDALKNGATGSLIEQQFLFAFKKEMFPRGKVVIIVKDSLRCLQELARYHRGKFSFPLIAVTGSNGKTTTKDFISSVLSTRYNVLKTEGNLNNHLGLPLTLLRLRQEHQAAVMELGMSAPGEIALLASLAKPGLGVITNVGEAHLGMLGSKENIARAKGELLESMGPGCKAFLNGDDLILRRMGKEFKGSTCYYGFEDGADLRALKSLNKDMNCIFTVMLPNKKVENFRIPLPGKHNVYNALAAIALGLEFSLGIPEIREGLKRSTFSRLRMEKTLVKGGFWLINDSYNANPTSMKAALQSLKELGRGSPAIAVLGDMLELGPAAEKKHFEVGEYLVALGIDYLITVGQLGSLIICGARSAGMPADKTFAAANHREAFEHLDTLSLKGSYLLLKGSRSMRMERIAEELLARYNVDDGSG
jgi:UDP-N-acetylmuramoyl-tripeptide--D-alanyl-D-alanine ligase